MCKIKLPITTYIVEDSQFYLYSIFKEQKNSNLTSTIKKKSFSVQCEVSGTLSEVFCEISCYSS